MDILRDLNTWFWNDYVWLPPNITWNDISDTGTVNYAQFSDLHNAFKVALALLVVRYILEQYIFSPIGCYLGLKPKVSRKTNNDVTENKVLEKAFCENGKIGYKQVQGLAKQLDWSERRVERWIRRRLSRSKPSTLSKFTESAWRFTFYLCAFCYGLYTLWDIDVEASLLLHISNGERFMYVVMLCVMITQARSLGCWQLIIVGMSIHTMILGALVFIDIPWFLRSVTDDIWWYYMLELGFYWSLTISQFMDTKRKDFLQMFVHHIVTIMLLTFSWTSNLFRIGSLVLVIHDFADVPLEAAKMAKYVESQRVADSCFAVFTVAWIISRLGLYPYRIIFNTMYEALFIVPMFPAYYVFNLLLCALQVLHIVWTWMIVKIALRAVSSKNPGVKDLRSDSDESYSSSTELEADAKDTSSQSNNASSQRTS